MRYAIAISLLLAGCSSGSERIPSKSVPPMSKPIQSQPFISNDPVALVNDYRKGHGLGSVVLDTKLVALAVEQSEAMASSGRLDHTAGAGTFMIRMSRAQVGGRIVENIGYGNPDFPRTLNQWIVSPQHKDNLLFRQANRMGYAKATASDGRVYHTLLLASGGHE